MLICSMPVGQAIADEIKGRAPALTICLDGGYGTAKQYEIPCDLVMGDFDSLEPEEILPGMEVIRFPVEKDYTDAMIGVMEGLRRGCTLFYIYGALGGRQDHHFHNLMLPLFLREHNARGFLISEDTIATVIQNEAIDIPQRSGFLLGVFAIGGDARGVSEEGVKYPLDRVVLQMGLPIGSGNQIEKEHARVTVTDGTLLVMQVREQ